MKLIVCLDEEKGMMFNHRRQSRDRLLVDDLVKSVGNNTLYMTAYSEKLFTPRPHNVRVVDDPLTAAGKNDYCFIEDPVLLHDFSQFTEVILYHWNRRYPTDATFDMDMQAFHLVKTEEFAGFSHEKITKEVWTT